MHSFFLKLCYKFIKSCIGYIQPKNLYINTFLFDIVSYRQFINLLSAIFLY